MRVRSSSRHIHYATRARERLFFDVRAEWGEKKSAHSITFSRDAYRRERTVAQIKKERGRKEKEERKRKKERKKECDA